MSSLLTLVPTKLLHIPDGIPPCKHQCKIILDLIYIVSDIGKNRIIFSRTYPVIRNLVIRRCTHTTERGLYNLFSPVAV